MRSKHLVEGDGFLKMSSACAWRRQQKEEGERLRRSIVRRVYPVLGASNKDETLNQQITCRCGFDGEQGIRALRGWTETTQLLGGIGVRRAKGQQLLRCPGCGRGRGPQQQVALHGAGFLAQQTGLVVPAIKPVSTASSGSGPPWAGHCRSCVAAT